MWEMILGSFCMIYFPVSCFMIILAFATFMARLELEWVTIEWFRVWSRIWLIMIPLWPIVLIIAVVWWILFTLGITNRFFHWRI